jgi:hypothetical protein
MKSAQTKEIRADIAKGEDNSFDPSFLARYDVEFSPTEKKVLLIAKDLMKKHYLLDAQDLNRQATREIKEASPDVINAAIQQLLSKKVLFDGAAMTRDKVLANEMRCRVFELICNRPGIHISRLKTLAGTDLRTILYHLRVLERFEFVRFEPVLNKKAYYEITSPREFDMIYYFMQEEGARTIFKSILENQGVALDDLGAILKGYMSIQTLARRIKILMDNKLISGKSEASKIISLAIPSRSRSIIKDLLSKGYEERIHQSR